MNQTERESIINIVKKIKQSTVENKETYFENEYATFKKKYPGLYSMACSDKVDMNNLFFMLGALSKMENDNLTQFDASAVGGQMLYNKYVEPTLPKME